ncbi:transcriptional coactivator p15/PC4 family protein [Emcibacter sp. SYSU 3D8]|uniref:transcriptional coactivator p15/PC4 family protein n=1 Tax=Emcibacter sp. SYSU 3D8 TaxID=3133969 RepID=UPI0031FF2EF6
MSDDQTNDEILIGHFEKNRVEDVRARFCTYHGRRYLDIRAFATSNATGERVPTRKGIALDPDKLEELRDLVDLAIEARDGGRHAAG